jgi:hypothetical protein
MSDQAPTFADVCHAIASGQLASTLDGSEYQVSALELRRYLHRFQSFPTISSPRNKANTQQALRAGRRNKPARRGLWFI